MGLYHIKILNLDIDFNDCALYYYYYYYCDIHHN